MPVSRRSLLPFLLACCAASAQGTAVPFGAGCPGGATTATGFAPNPGAGNIALYQANVPPGAIPVACLGFSAAQWGALPLPYDLGYLGLPGCSILVEPAAQTWTALPATGTAAAFLRVPPDPTFTGARLFGQWVDLGDGRVNAALPVTTSNGVAFTLGPVVGLPGLTVTGDPTALNGASWTYVGTTEGIAYDLRGLLFVPAGPVPPALRPAVILSHGAGGNVNGYSAAIARTMVGWGLVCIMTNLTHAGGVPLGAPGTAADHGASLANARRNVKCRDILQSLGTVDMARVAAHGHSMGAFATGATIGLFPELFLCASHTAGGLSDQPAAVATETAQARGIRAPYQLHHGDADTVVPLGLDQQLRAVLLTNPTVNELRVYAGFTHSQIAQDAGMLAAVRAWYTAHGLFP